MKRAKTKLVLGQKVQFERELQREHDFPAGRVWWKAVPRVGEGVLVGLRTLQQGYVTQDSDYDEFSGRTFRWNTWNHTGTVKAALVAIHMYQKPIFVPREEVE